MRLDWFRVKKNHQIWGIRFHKHARYCHFVVDNKTKVTVCRSNLSNKNATDARRTVKERLAFPSVSEDVNRGPIDNISEIPEKPDPGSVSSALTQVILCSGFPTQLLLVLILNGLGLNAISSDGQLSFGYVVTLSLIDALLLVCLIKYFLDAHGESMRSLVAGKKPILSEVTLGLILTPLLVVCAIGGLLLIRTIAPSLSNATNNPLEAMISTPLRAILFGFVVVIAGGFREELQRAFILRRFEQHLGGGWLGLVLFSILFGLGHRLQGWDAVIMTGMLGAFWGLLYLLRGSAVTSIVSHAGFNLLEVTLAFSAAQSL